MPEDFYEAEDLFDGPTPAAGDDESHAWFGDGAELTDADCDSEGADDGW
jgi:hypothetical protein